MRHLKHLGLQFHSSNVTVLFHTVSDQRPEIGGKIWDINRVANNVSYVYWDMGEDGSVIRLPMAELLGLIYGKRSKSVSAPYNFSFILSKFESSSYGRSLKWRKLAIDYVHQFRNEAYKAWKSAPTLPTQSYSWFIYRETLLYTSFPFLIWDMTTHEEDKVKFYIFLNSAVSGSEYSYSHPGCFTAVESLTGSHCKVAGWAPEQV